MNKLTLFVCLCLVGCSFVAAGGGCSYEISYYFDVESPLNTYFWNNCATAGKDYFSQDFTQASNYISLGLSICYKYTDSTVRKNCETDNSLSAQTAIIQAAYKCYVDYYSQQAGVCSNSKTCDSELNNCDYTDYKQGASSTVLALHAFTNTNFQAFQTDMKLGLKSTKCPDISTNCSSLTSVWQTYCINAYSQKCMDNYLNTNYASDLSVIAYKCLQTTQSFGLLVKLSFLSLIAFLVF